jgi:hypothetical protein
LTAFTGVDSQNLPDVMVSVQFILAIGVKNNLHNFPWINPKITFESAIQKQLNDFVKNNPDLKIRNTINDSENKNDRASY